MEPLKIATVQFETRDNDKVYNLSIIREMCRKASVEGADVVAFHECSVCGYTFAKDLSREELLAIAEPIPTGESTQALIAIAKEFGVTLLAGFFERHGDRIYKAQVCVDGNGLKAKYRKLHPFINPNILPGDQYVVFEIKGWKCGILICYDNNIIENVRATALLGADIKNGCSMILDPFGDIVAECRKLGDDFVIATAIPEKLRQAGGYRYRNARRPELYADIIGQPHESNQKVAWLTETTNSK